MSTAPMNPTPPTSSLPPVARLSRYSTDDIEKALQNLRAIYVPRTLPRLPSPARALPKHVIHDTSVPDSGYASAEEDECAGTGEEAEPEDFDLEALREDLFEKEFAIRWLTAFAARSDGWVYDVPEEEDARTALVDSAATLLASLSGAQEADDAPEDGLTRTFTFPSPGGKVDVILNDAPLSNTDHTSVGLQSWGSAIVFAERMCAAPASFGLDPSARGLRILELGAGTGLLSLAAAQLLPAALVVATDYHPSVLANLEANAATNLRPVSVRALDWQHPRYAAPLDAPFDVVLAADVVYHPEHARWISRCVAHLLARDRGVFWLIIPVRSTGRHEGMGSTVEAVFPVASAAAKGELAILGMEKMEKHGGIGRADESGYTLFKIGWA
ncbi:hypothetical protein PHLGIDRAFT_292214 [Phlebiopsis gigantea 11061_1 CR5-6]|uniref:Uncharacterized protein n=1 Tax=Phlebiopsis gigantea (strain 11061_1 CR5-6) TaxID=745531 RepID=A0A0C3RR70_PHLG1|nr:hypothetical protein PHLGIDRAFT_292214 [Phlebiopsis gigantea 11061_1 CR5-6]